MDERELYHKVRRRVKQIKAFYEHLAIYLILNAGLVVINFLDTPETIWFIYPLIFWGLIVIIHGIRTFSGKLLGDDWEEKKINQMMKESGDE